MSFVAFAQVGSALATVVLAMVALLQVLEVRRARIEQQRPHIIVDADYSHRTVVSIVVRNIGVGAAKRISFDFSAPLKSTLQDPRGVSDSFVVSNLPYFKEGLDYLAPGSELRSGWDTYINLFQLLSEEGLDNGIEVKINYQDLHGRNYSTLWRINPLKIEHSLDFTGPDEKALLEIAKATKQIARKMSS